MQPQARRTAVCHTLSRGASPRLAPLPVESGSGSGSGSERGGREEQGEGSARVQRDFSAGSAFSVSEDCREPKVGDFELIRPTQEAILGLEVPVGHPYHVGCWVQHRYWVQVGVWGVEILGGGSTQGLQSTG